MRFDKIGRTRTSFASLFSKGIGEKRLKTASE